jgi:L-amino acid N-acyltransferase YncA
LIELIGNQHERACKWLLSQFGPKFERMMPDYKTLMAVENGHVLGAVVYDSFTIYDCNITLAIKDRRCVTRRVISAVFSYPFLQLGLRRVSASVAADNEVSLRLMKRWGFRFEGLKIFGDGLPDEFQFGMLANECRWLK